MQLITLAEIWKSEVEKEFPKLALDKKVLRIMRSTTWKMSKIGNF